MEQYSTYSNRKKSLGDIFLYAKHKRAHSKSSLLWYWIYMIVLFAYIVKAIPDFIEWNRSSQMAWKIANELGEGTVYYDTIKSVLVPMDIFMYALLILGILSSLLCIISLLTLTEIGYKYVRFFQYFNLGLLIATHIFKVVMVSKVADVPVGTAFAASLLEIVISCGIGIALLVWNRRYFEDREALFDDDVNIA